MSRPSNLVDTVLRMRAWTLLLTVIVIAEVLTALMNTANSYLWWGRLDRDLLLIGVVDAFFVSFIVGGMLIVMLNQLRRREQNIQKQKNESEGIIAAIGDSMSIISRDFRVTYQNDIHRNTFGDKTGHICHEVFFKRDSICDGCPVKQVFADGNIHTVERSRDIEGDRRYYENTSAPIRDVSGAIIASVQIIRNITARKQMETALSNAKREWEETFNTIDDIITIHDNDFTILRANQTAMKTLGIKEADLGKIKCFNAYHNLHTVPDFCPVLKTNGGDSPSTVKRHNSHLNMYMETSILPRFDEQNQKIGNIHIARDITESQRIEQQLKQSEQRYRNLFEQSMLAIGISKGNTPIDANRALLELQGFESLDEFKKVPLLDKVTAESAEILKEQLRKLQLGEVPDSRYELDIIRRDGEVRHVEVMTNPIFIDGEMYSQATFNDITDRKKMETMMIRIIKEKETLLMELHHRTKNNLAVIQSLLNVQSKRITDSKARDAILESKHRLRCISLIHDQLSSSTMDKEIDFNTYVNNLSFELIKAYKRDNVFLNLVIDVPDITLDASKVVPCGLIINELLTNALKYAFQGRKKGELHVKMTADDRKNTIIVKDNGVGLPENFDIYSSETLGIQIVTSLISQLNGTLQINTKEGTEFIITFAMD